MKKNELLRLGVAKLETGFRLKNSPFAFLLLAGLSFSACHERGCDEPEPIGRCGTIEPYGCRTFATAQNAMCGQGVWGGIWLKLDDGTWLQPFENSVSGATLEIGQRYKFGYEKMARDNRYDGQVNCMAVPPAAEAVRITCLTAEEPETTTTK